MNQYLSESRIQNDPNPTRRARHGLVWTKKEYYELQYLWQETDKSFEEICNHLERSHAGVFAKLQQHFKYVVYDSKSYSYKCLYRNQGDSMPFIAGTNVSAAISNTTGAVNCISMNSDVRYSIPTPAEYKEPVMQPTIETKTFINGQNAAILTDEQIFQKIARLEQEIDKLKAIRAKSTKLEASIEAMEKDVADLVAYVDAR